MLSFYWKLEPFDKIFIFNNTSENWITVTVEYLTFMFSVQPHSVCRCVYICMYDLSKRERVRAGGSVKTRLSKDCNLLGWQWRHVLAVLGHLQVISYLQLTIVKRKHIHRLTWRYCVFVVFNEISLLTGLCFICSWLKLYKYVKSVLN